MGSRYRPPYPLLVRSPRPPVAERHRGDCDRPLLARSQAAPYLASSPRPVEVLRRQSLARPY